MNQSLSLLTIPIITAKARSKGANNLINHTIRINNKTIDSNVKLIMVDSIIGTVNKRINNTLIIIQFGGY
jgi:hypothetical protein